MTLDTDPARAAAAAIAVRLRESPLQMYTFGVYPGLRGLCASGMTAAHGFTPECGPVQYPQMLRWLRD